jgi:hypothetical protein
MKAKELIEKLTGYEDFDLKFCISDKNINSKFFYIRTFGIEVTYIGYSDKVIVLGGDEEK